MAEETIAEALDACFITEEEDEFGNRYNLTEVLRILANNLRLGMRDLGLRDADTGMGAIEAHAKSVTDAADHLSGALGEVAASIDRHSEELNEGLKAVAAAIRYHAEKTSPFHSPMGGDA